MSVKSLITVVLFYCFAVLAGRVCSAQVSFQGDFLGGQKFGQFDTWGLAAADFNGDGKLDIAGVNANENRLAVYLGNGDGTFQGGLTHAITGAPNFPMSVTTTDVNGDGKLDLVVASFNTLGVTGGGAISVFLGNGDGTFQSQVDYVVAKHPSSVVAADFNGDGKPDLAVAVNDTASVAVLLNNGDGTFRPPVSYGAGNGPYSLAVSDFNGDGKSDLVVTNYCNMSLKNAGPPFCNASNQFYGTVSILLGNGDGTFQAAKPYAAGIAPYAVAVADFNQDGKADVVVTDNSSRATIVLLGNGDGTLQFPVTYPGDGGAFVVAADFSGNGQQQVATTGISIAELRGNGASSFQPTIDYYRSTSGQPYFYAAVGDFNGDGHPDVAVGFETVFSVFLNAASATRQPTTNSVQTVYNGCGSLTVTTNVTSLGGTVPTGTVTLQVDGEYFAPQFGSLDASGNASSNILLTPGTHTITSVYSGDSFTQATSTSVAVNIQPQPSQTSLSSSPNPSTLGQAVTFTAVVVSSGESACLNGIITFLDGTTVLATVPFGITPSNPQPNQATLTTSALGAGNHAITASYGGATFISPSISAAVVQVVTGTNLSLGVAQGSSSSATVTAGSTASYMLSIGGGGFSGTITLSCKGAPTGASCSVPAPLGVSATQASQFTVKVSTTPQTMGTTFPNRFTPLPFLWAGVIVGLLRLPTVGKPAKRSMAPRDWMRKLPLLLLLLLVLCCCGGNSGSNEGSHGSGGTPAGSYTLTVTATSGSIQQAVPIMLIVD